MAYHPRIESPELVSFCTTRTRNSELWFINNHRLEQEMLANIAKYTNLHDVALYALAIEGNHHHELALFPRCNRFEYMRDINSSIARAVKRHCGQYPGGGLFARRYSNEFTPGAEDIEEYFFYTVLQPVKDGLIRHIKEYPGYNCFYDAVRGLSRKYKIVNWTEYNEQRRWNNSIRIEDFTYLVELKFQRLPGYEVLSQSEYEVLMTQKLEKRIQDIRLERSTKDKGFLGRDKLIKKQPGTLPYHTKRSLFGTKRPRILCVCPIRWAKCIAWYFNIYFAFKLASERYRQGEFEVEFPPGTFRPHLFVGIK